MKKLLFILILIFSYLQSFTCEKDSIFDIRLQHDSLDYKLNVVFKNISNDTVWLQKYFKNYFFELEYAPGFRINFFSNYRQFAPNWGEVPQNLYVIDNRKRVGNYNISMAPQEEVLLTIQLPFGLFLKSESEKKNKKSDYLCIVLELYYRYFVPEEKKVKMNYFKSDCFELKYKKNSLYEKATIYFNANF